MNKEELLLEIIEKVHERSLETAKMVQELQIEQVRQGEMHKRNTDNLEEHMARTEANEARILLIEKHVAFVNSVIKIITAGGAILLFLIKVLPYLNSLV
jgi:hypothetical protein